MTFQEQLHEARKAAGLSQEQLANLMNMSRQGVSHWENGRTLPDAETLKKLSQVLNYYFIAEEAPCCGGNPGGVCGGGNGIQSRAQA